MRCKWNTISLFTAVSAIATVTTAEESAVTVVQSRVPQKRCDHPIYCDGPILKAVQLSGIFDNDKTFVDMPTRKPVGDIVTAFNALPANASKSVLSQFVDTNFYPAGSDVVEAELDDWNDNPPFLDGVTDPVLRGYGMAIHNRWKTMARKRDTSFLCDGCESSLLPINNVFFAAGGDSSREYRYWNTYYIEIGLLNSGLYTTAKGVLQNLLDMIKLYDFVPTGGRIYYTDRTETPLLALMIKTYYDATKDLAFVTEALPLLKIEHEFWESYRSVNITYTRNSASSLFDKRQSKSQIVNSKIATYGPDLFSTDSSNSTLLRPESYSSDVAIVAAAARTTAPNLFSSSLTGSGLYAATEAGTTPSIQFANKDTVTQAPNLFGRRSLSRRTIDIPTSNPFAGFTKDQLTVLGSVEINTTIAVSLNSILYQAEMIIADLIELVDNKTSPECKSYRSRAEDRRQLLLDLTYNSESGLFADYHLASGKQTDIWSITSLWPYWAFGESLPEGGAQKAVDNFDFLHQRFPGGMPNTLYNTSLSWDYPNVQPPLQHMAVRSSQNAQTQGCSNSSSHGTPCGNIAASIAQSMVNTAFCNWYTTGGSIDNVLNPYDDATGNATGADFGSFSIGPDGNAITTTSAASQGDYSWTNGISLWLLGQYKTQLQMPSCPNIKLNLVTQTHSPSSLATYYTTALSSSLPSYTTISSLPATYYSTSPLPPLKSSTYNNGRSCVRKRVCTQCRRTVVHKWVSRNSGADCTVSSRKRSPLQLD